MAKEPLDGVEVLVSGANGFVGSRTCAALAANGATVRALVRREGAAPDVAGVIEVVGRFDDAADAAAACDGADVVVHTVATAGDDLDEARVVNVDGTATLLTAAREAGVRRVVHVSTTSVYARPDGGDVVDEDTALVEDGSVYAVTKVEGEAAAREAAGTDVELVVLRPPGVLGWSPTSTWGQRLPASMVAGEPLMTFPPDGTQGWVHVDDLADAIVVCCTHPSAAGLVANVVGGSWSWADYDRAVRERVPEATTALAQDREGWSGTYAADRVTAMIGWSPSRDAESAMDEVAANVDAVRAG